MVVARAELRYRARTVPRELISQAAYARRRHLSQTAVWKRTTTAGGPIPVHGPRKQIDLVEADALWEGTKTAQGEGGAAHRAETAAVLDASTYLQAKTARMVTLAKRDALELRVREGQLVDRQAAERAAEELLRRVRDSFLRWPARVAPALATRWERDAAEVADVLAAAMRVHLEELAEVTLALDRHG
jgi:hypothetical protein